MVRKTGIKVRVSPSGIGYTATPEGREWRDHFSRHMTGYTWLHGRTEDLAQVYFQEDYQLPEEIRSHRYYNELSRGWDLVLLVDPWIFAGWLGYDAQDCGPNCLCRTEGG